MPGPASSTTLVVMGVSGVGKTSVARALADRTGWSFAEGDTLHPDRNRELMALGRPLTDEDRWPWLRRVTTWIGGWEADGRDAVITCSALRRAYRDLLRDGHPSVRFVHLLAPAEVLRERLERRRGHFMPASLLASQLAALEPLAADEPGVAVASAGAPDAVAVRALAALGIPITGRYRP